MLRALLSRIVIMIFQEVSFSKLGLQLGGSKEKTQILKSKKSPATKFLCSFEALSLDLAQSRLSFSSKML
jgi:hypothetical protein